MSGTTTSAHSPAISDDRLKAATGRSRQRWFALLDKAGAESWDRRRIARWLGVKHEVDAWWAQSLTIDYERARGLRQGRTRKRPPRTARSSRWACTSSSRRHPAKAALRSPWSIRVCTTLPRSPRPRSSGRPAWPSSPRNSSDAGAHGRIGPYASRQFLRRSPPRAVRHRGQREFRPSQRGSGRPQKRRSPRKKAPG